MSFLPLIKILLLLLATNPLLYVLYKVKVTENRLSWESDGLVSETNSDTLTPVLMQPESLSDGVTFNARFVEFGLYCLDESMKIFDKSTSDSEEVFQLQLKTQENHSCNIIQAKPCCKMFFIATLLSLVLFQTLEYNMSCDINKQILEDIEERKNKTPKQVPVPILSFRRTIPGGLGHLLQQKLDVHYIHEDFTLVSRSSS